MCSATVDFVFVSFFLFSLIRDWARWALNMRTCSTSPIISFRIFVFYVPNVYAATSMHSVSLKETLFVVTGIGDGFLTLLQHQRKYQHRTTSSARHSHSHWMHHLYRRLKLVSDIIIWCMFQRCNYKIHRKQKHNGYDLVRSSPCNAIQHNTARLLPLLTISNQLAESQIY